jgi:GNAT superfamily N-acetyltransferase
MNYTFFERGFVSLIYVHATHRRKGIAGLLFEEFEAPCVTDRIFTAANQSNQRCWPAKI